VGATGSRHPNWVEVPKWATRGLETITG